MNILVDYAFEIVAIVIAGLALIAAERAIRISKQALQLTKNTGLVTLRMRAQEVTSEAERSLLALQGDCRQACEQWEDYYRKQRPMMSLGIFERPKELKSIHMLERTGRTLLQEVFEQAPTQEVSDEKKFENFIGVAKTNSLQIERLRLQLEAPRPFPH